MLADRRAAIEGLGHPLSAGLALEAQAGMETFQTALEGARRFAGGEGARRRGRRRLIHSRPHAAGGRLARSDTRGGDR